MPFRPASSALDHIKVLDLTRARAGPTAARQLADFGADVIKIEAPGDPNYADMGTRHGPDFQNLHRNKRSLTLDLKSPEGHKIFMKLAAQADVIVENYRPDVKHRLKISYDDVRAVNKGIVYASISGFGQTGPDALRPAYDMVVQGMGGLMSLTGHADGPPTRVGRHGPDHDVPRHRLHRGARPDRFRRLHPPDALIGSPPFRGNQRTPEKRDEPMRNRRIRLLAAPLLALVGVLAFAGPAHAAGATVGACMAEEIEHLIEEAHGDLDHVKHELHDNKKVQEEIEGCFEAPNPIIPEVNEIIWGGAAFLILFVLMVKKGFPAVKGAMDARAEKIRNDLDAAEQGRAGLMGPRLHVAASLVRELLETSWVAPGVEPPRAVGSVAPQPHLKDVARQLERELFERLFAETEGDFEAMAARLLEGDPATNARRVRTRFNQLGLSARELRDGR